MATYVLTPHVIQTPLQLGVEQFPEEEYEDRSPGAGPPPESKFKIKRDGEWVEVS